MQAKRILSRATAMCASALLFTLGHSFGQDKPKTDWVEPPAIKGPPQPGQPTVANGGFSFRTVQPHFASTTDPHPDLFPDLPKGGEADEHDIEPPTKGIKTVPKNLAIDASATGVSAQAANALRNWDSLGPNGWVPPDPAVAVGPHHIVVMTNDDWAIYNKRGVLQYSVDINAFTGDSGKFYDPRCVYDTHSGRWLLLYLRIDDVVKTSSWVVFVSDDSDPNGSWWWYYLDATYDGSNATSNWADYPDIGFDEQSIYLTGNMFQFGGSFQYSKIRILYKSQIYAGTGASWYDFWGMTNDGSTKSRTIRSAKAYSNPGVGLFVNAYGPGADYIVVWKISGPASGSPSLAGSKLTVASYAASGSADQQGTTQNLENINSIIQNCAYYSLHLWCAHTVNYDWGDGNGPVSCIKYYDIYTPTPSVNAEQTWGAPGYAYFYPAIDVDYDGDMALVFDRSGPAEYPSIRHSGRRTSDSGIEGSGLLREGTGYYSALTDGRCRWGDYSGIALDPWNGNTWWIYSEYGESGNTWGTYLGEISWDRGYDSTGPTYSNFSPTQTTTQTPNVSVNAQDTDSGLYPSSAYYRYSTDGGSSWFSWVPTACTGVDSSNSVETISHASVQFLQDSMTQNKVQFYVEDMFGNPTYSAYYNVAIDTTPPYYITYGPTVTNDQTPNISIVARDLTSGLNVASAEYWYTKDAGATYTGPLSAPMTGSNGTTAPQTATASNVPYNQDSLTKNQIWFAVFDMFGWYVDSGWLTIQVDSVAPGGWKNFTPTGVVNGGSPTCTVQVQDTAVGLAVSTAQFRFTKNAGSTWSAWSGCSCTGSDGTTAFQTISAVVPFNQHDLSGNNRVEFRIQDLAGNLGTSADYVVLIDKLVEVYGHVTLGNFVGNPAGMPFVLELWNGASLVETLSTTLDASANYDVFFGNTGGTFLRAKPDHHLRVKQNGALVSSPNKINWNIPYNGDGVANNQVDLNDLTLVLLNWSLPGGPGDYNGDLSVDIYDLTIGLGNFGIVGD